MQKYRCYIVDDEPIAIDIIRHYLEKLPNFEVVGSFDDPLEAFLALKEQPVDLLFLDIQMPGLTGIDLLQTISNPPEVIFTTAYREYAFEGFELNVLDYLLKPIAFNRFLQAIDKFLLKKKKETAVPAAKAETSEVLTVRADRKTVRIKLSDILFIEGLKDYVKIILPDRQVVTKELISQMEKRLPSDQFVRVHRSYIIAKGKIDAFTATEVEIGQFEIPIGRKYRGLI